ncbi:hypothetical protein E1301_Tti005720 [Triplophysa tibetana]|uniref:Uncharacterized protein n=1 Tax=Triplophysa tibetana TaxID=1572043 RepID=A0A5A9NJT0_9TELE|nr:hypothetical protein E1301_Tti005720 [Triplophysa tibetana]
MSGFLYRGRHCNGRKADRPKSMINMSDSPNDDTEKISVLQTPSVREFEQSVDIWHLHAATQQTNR